MVLVVDIFFHMNLYHNSVVKTLFNTAFDKRYYIYILLSILASFVYCDLFVASFITTPIARSRTHGFFAESFLIFHLFSMIMRTITYCIPIVIG